MIVIWCSCVAGKHDAWKETEFKGGACACRLWARRSFKWERRYWVGEHGKYTSVLRSSTEINMYYRNGPELNLFTARLHVHWHLQLCICSAAWIKHISLCHSTDRGRFFICHYISVAAFSIFGGIWLFCVLVENACFNLSLSSGDNILVVASCP